MSTQEIYVSTDVETDGPIPGEYSMLSFASAAFTINGNLIGTFNRNLDILSGAKQDPDTMAWWNQSRNREAWESHRNGTVDPYSAMSSYVKWLESLPGLPVFVGYPAGFDFTFIYWYLIKYAGRSPFSFSAIDIKSYAMAILGSNYRETTKRNMPKRWFGDTKHTHVAIDDAIEQGELFINILKERNTGVYGYSRN